MEYKYYPMHMHIHAGCDYGSSMALNMYNASLLGMKYIWFTDHDTRMGLRKNAVTGFSFDEPELVKNEEVGHHGFKVIDEKTEYSIDANEKTFTLYSHSAKSEEWQNSGVYFYSTGTRHTCSLASGVTLSVDLKHTELCENSRLIFAVKLSQRPPDMANAYMLYVIGSTEGLQGEHIQIISLDKQNGTVVMPISKDVSEDISVGGTDNAFDTLYMVLQTKNGASARVELGKFNIQREKYGEALRKELQKVADRVGCHYGVKPFVSFEVSAAGEHKNCYGNVPLIEYHNHNYCVTEAEAIEYIENHKGIFAINHPFAGTKFKRIGECTDEKYRVLFHEFLEEIAKSKALGATLMEVGFPLGRIFPFEYYLKLWDMLSLKGIFVTGYGASDCHRNNEGWFDGNNFVAYIGVDSELSHPIEAGAFTDAMKKGRVYTGNPVKLKGTIEFKTTDGYEMGSVLVGKNKVEICFSAKNISPGWELRLVENGRTIHSQKIETQNFEYTSVLELNEENVVFHRAELWDEEGRCVMLTNPIYIASSHFLEEHKNDARVCERSCMP